VLSAIPFREARTHPDVCDHLRALYTALKEFTEAVLDAASSRNLDHGRKDSGGRYLRGHAAARGQLHLFNGPVPALGAIAEIVSGVLLTWDNPQKATKLPGGRHDGFRRRPGRTCDTPHADVDPFAGTKAPIREQPEGVACRSSVRTM